MTTTTRDLTKLRESVSEIAKESGQALLETVTELQAAAAKTGQDELLDDLCQLKREELGI